MARPPRQLWVAAGAAALAGGNMGAGAAVRAGGGAAGGVSPEVVSAGAYRSISVELKLHHLAVAAVQQVRRLLLLLLLLQLWDCSCAKCAQRV